MMVKGTKIKFKEDTPFAKMFKSSVCNNDILEIYDLDKSGNILIKGNIGFGVVSFTEFDSYFEEYKEPKKEWSDWHLYGKYSTGREFFVNDGHEHYIAYRIKGNTVQVKLTSGCSMTAKAKCSPYDKFDLDTGVTLALARLYLKLAKARVAVKCMLEDVTKDAKVRRV